MSPSQIRAGSDPHTWLPGTTDRRISANVLARRLEQSLAILETLGVRVPPTGRHRKAILTLDKWNEAPDSIDLSDEVLARIMEAHRAAWETFVITFAADDYRAQRRSPFVQARLQTMMGGGEIGDGNNTAPRNAQFELYVAAMLHISGLDVRQGEPDLRFLYAGYELVGVAAKRVRSMNPDQVKKRLREARRQIAGTSLRGWIAVNIDIRFSSVDPLLPTEALLGRFEDAFNEINGSLAYVRPDPRLLGFMAFGHASAWDRSEGGRRPRLHTAYPVRWVRWSDDAVERMVFEEFTASWHSRIEPKLHQMASQDFIGKL